MNFDISFDRLIGNEGGYTSGLVGDPGGETNWGISKRSYPNIDIKGLTRADAKLIYLHDFWDRGKMDQFPFAIGYQTFDLAVNCGINAALHMLQRAAGVADDGIIGPISMAAIQNTKVPVLLVRLFAEELDYRRRLSTFKTFGAGWTARVANDLRYAAADLK